MVTSEKYTNIAKSSSISIYEDSGLYALISLKEDNEEEKPYEIFQRLKNFYSQERGDPSILERLKKAFLSVKSENLEIGLVALTEKTIYALCYNGAGLILSRGEKLIPLIKTSINERLTVSGFLQPNDSFSLANHHAFSTMSLDEIKAGLFREGEEDSAVLVLKVVDDSLTAVAQIKESGAPDIQPSHTGKVKMQTVNLIDKLLKLIPEKKIRVEEADYAFRTKRKNRTASLVGVLLLALLGVSIYFGMNAGRAKKVKEEYEPRLTQAREYLEEAISLYSLSPTRAQELILEAQVIAKELENLQVEDERISQLSSEIDSNLGPIAGIYSEESQLYIDLSLISSGFVGNRLAFSGDTIRVLDTESRKLVGIELENKKTNIISGPDYLPDSKDVFAYEDRSFILSSDGIREVTDDVELVVKPEDWSAGDIIAQAFAGNIYVLDKTKNTILRYSGVRDGFLPSDTWLGKGVEPDFSRVSEIAIDGSIWALSESGDISQFSLGIPVAFNLDGLRSGLGSADDLFTAEEFSFIYILDASGGRVVVLDKSGLYKGEYRSSELSKATQIIVSEIAKKLIFLSEGKLYELELKHLD